MTARTLFGAGRSGTRRITPGSLAAMRAAASWDGLPADIDDHWVLLRLLERSWRTLGLSQDLFCHLSYLVRRTRTPDWWAGSRPVVWESLDALAVRFGCCRKTVRNRERVLAELGFLTWHDSGNYKRYGSRNAAGRILYAYGVDLSPFAALAGALQRAAAAEEAERRERDVEVRRRGHLRAEIRRLLTALERPDEAPGVNTEDAPPAIAELRACNRELAVWRDALLHEALGRVVAEGGGHAEPAVEEGEGGHNKASSLPHFTTKVVTDYPHIQYKQQEPSSKRTTCNAARSAGTAEPGVTAPRPAPRTGIEHIQIEDVLAIATPRLVELLPSWDPPDWRDIIAAASVLRSEMGASRWVWLDGVALIGPAATAVAVIVAHARACDPGRLVRNPGGFLRGCLRKAEANELHLHRTVFGLAARRAALDDSAKRLHAAWDEVAS